MGSCSRIDSRDGIYVKSYFSKSFLNLSAKTSSSSSLSKQFFQFALSGFSSVVAASSIPRCIGKKIGVDFLSFMKTKRFFVTVS
jgi:hypothetical protein